MQLSKNDISISAQNMSLGEGAKLNASNNTIAMDNGIGTLNWKGDLSSKGNYQVWLTYFGEDDDALVSLDINGHQKKATLMDIGPSKILRFYNEAGRPVNSKKNINTKTYYFRQYLGTFPLKNDIDLQIKLKSNKKLVAERIELIQEGHYTKELEPLLFNAINFYDYMYVPNGLTRCVYTLSKQRAGTLSSIAVCGISLMSFCMSYELKKDSNIAKKVLKLLQAVNGKKTHLNVDRDSSGLFRHFLNSETGKSKSEFSTIDTSILVCGALFCRNTFKNPKITAEADKLWNSNKMAKNYCQ